MSDDDIYWYYNHAEAEMGVQSNFGPIISAIMSSGASRTSLPDNMTDGRVKAATRYRVITARLTKLAPRVRMILHAAYLPRQWSPQVLGKFGMHAGVTVYSVVANKFFDEDGGTDDRSWFQWLEGIIIRDERDRIAAIRKDAETILREAIDAYGETI